MSAHPMDIHFIDEVDLSDAHIDAVKNARIRIEDIVILADALRNEAREAGASIASDTSYQVAALLYQIERATLDRQFTPTK